MKYKIGDKVLHKGNAAEIKDMSDQDHILIEFLASPGYYGWTNGSKISHYSGVFWWTSAYNLKKLQVVEDYEIY